MHYVKRSLLFTSFYLLHFLRLSLTLMTLVLSKITNQLIYRMTLNLGLSDDIR